MIEVIGLVSSWNAMYVDQIEILKANVVTNYIVHWFAISKSHLCILYINYVYINTAYIDTI